MCSHPVQARPESVQALCKQSFHCNAVFHFVEPCANQHLTICITVTATPDLGSQSQQFNDIVVCQLLDCTGSAAFILGLTYTNIVADAYDKSISVNYTILNLRRGATMGYT